MHQVAAQATPAARRRETLRDRQKQDTRVRLIDAADRLFHERGYHLATVEDIAAEAGASRATFYLHFAGKAEIAVEIFAAVDPGVGEMARRLDVLDRTSRAEVRVWLNDAIAWWQEHRAHVEAYQQVVAAEPIVAREWVTETQRLIDQMPHYLGCWEGDARERARLRMMTLMMQLDRVCYFYIVRDSPLDPESLLDVLVEQWWAALNTD